MHIDTHQHYWRYSAADYGWIGDTMATLKRDFLPGDVWAEMARAGFDASIAVQARQTPEETAGLLRLADQHPFVVGVIGWVDLQADDVREQLEGMVGHPKLIGVRHIVHDESDDRFLLRPAFCRGVATLAEFGLTYDILVFPRHLPVVAEFIGRFPEQRFVLDHLAKPEIRSGRIDEWGRQLSRIAAYPRVVAKLSGLVTEALWQDWKPQDLRPYLDVAFDLFGPGRLMVGSDWPVCTLAGDYGRTMAVVTEYLGDRPAGEREAVLGGTARKFWDLPVMGELR